MLPTSWLSARRSKDWSWARGFAAASAFLAFPEGACAHPRLSDVDDGEVFGIHSSFLSRLLIFMFVKTTLCSDRGLYLIRS
jgi:hypothetical protein